MLARDKSATKPYTIGLTYRVAEVGLICRTTKVLETANRNGVVTEDQAEMLGCLMLDPERSSKVTLLDKDPNVLKVRMIAPNLESDVIRVGRTFRRLVPNPSSQNNRCFDRRECSKKVGLAGLAPSMVKTGALGGRP